MKIEVLNQDLEKGYTEYKAKIRKRGIYYEVSVPAQFGEKYYQKVVKVIIQVEGDE